MYGDVQAMVMAPASVQPDEQICSMPSLAAIRLTVYSRAAVHGCHMPMAAGLGMLGSLTCVRLLSTVSKTGAIMEKSVPGELSSWLDLRRRARSQHVQRMQKGERRKALSTNADTFGLSMGRSPFPEAGSAMQIHRVESAPVVANLSGLAGRGVPASSPILSRSMAVHCCIMRVTPFACST